MAIEKMKIKVVNKLFDAGYTDEKSILAIGIKELVSLRLSADENIAFDELQNAIKKNKVISYLAEKPEEASVKPDPPKNPYTGY